jgi:ribosomal protein S1
MTNTLQETENLFEVSSFIKKSTKKLTLYQQQFLHLYEGYSPKFPTTGNIYSLKYLGQMGRDHIFDGGFKDFVRVEARSIENKYLENTQEGGDVDVMIVDMQEVPFLIRGSISSIYENRVQRELVRLGEDDFVTGTIRESNPAGYKILFNYGGVTLTGFMPNTLAGVNKLFAPESIVGQTLEFGVESFSKEEGTYILSRRKYLQSLIPDMIKKLEVGKLYRGLVTGTTEFGIFVEWSDCLTGMIHKTNLNPDYKMSQIQSGMAIEFYVKEIIREKIILTQILKTSLWDEIKTGMVLRGTVKENKGFGTLVSFDEETVGLIHTSEIEKHSLKPQVGSSIDVKIIAIDRLSRKIFLTTPKGQKAE